MKWFVICHAFKPHIFIIKVIAMDFLEPDYNHNLWYNTIFLSREYHYANYECLRIHIYLLFLLWRFWLWKILLAINLMKIYHQLKITIEIEFATKRCEKKICTVNKCIICVYHRLSSFFNLLYACCLLK